MNDGNQDRIIDSFLEEMLTNQHPPNLTEQIQARLREELGPEGFQQLRSARLGARAATKANGHVVTPSVVKRPDAKVRMALVSRWRNLSVVGLTLAAGVMLAFAVWRYSSVNSSKNLQFKHLFTQPERAEAR